MEGLDAGIPLQVQISQLVVFPSHLQYRGQARSGAVQGCAEEESYPAGWSRIASGGRGREERLEAGVAAVGDGVPGAD